MITRLAVDSAVCTGCGTCINSCPTDVLRLAPDTNKVFAAFPDDCQGCRLCVIDCPVEAIEVNGKIVPAFPMEDLVAIY